jgi:hypothetical protein
VSVSHPGTASQFEPRHDNALNHNLVIVQPELLSQFVSRYSLTKMRALT